MARKTFNVDDFRNQVNDVLRNSVSSAEERKGWMTALENILHSTGNYNGFCYLNETLVPAGQLPGIREELDELFVNTDNTRVHYF